MGAGRGAERRQQESANPERWYRSAGKPPDGGSTTAERQSFFCARSSWCLPRAGTALRTGQVRARQRRLLLRLQCQGRLYAQQQRPADGVWLPEPRRFSLRADTTYTWGTATATARWNHTFNDKLLSSVTGVVGDYDYGVEAETEPYSYTLDSEIKYKQIRADLNFEPTVRHKMGLGASSSWYEFSPGTLTPGSELSSLLPVSMPRERSVEAALYLDHEYTLNPRISVSYGLRYSSYYNLGPGDVYVYDPESPRRESTIIDTLSYSNGGVIQQYGNFEPRASLKISLGENSSVKLGYNRMAQYIHLISNTTAASPVDIWKTSNPNLRRRSVIR
nr:TonB-dependent receptor [Pontibacter sp. BAB1700]